MPNHLTTVCTVTGPRESIAQLSANHFTTETNERTGETFVRFNFETIIQPPECVRGTQSGSEADAGFYALTGFIPTHFVGLAHHPVQHYIRRGFDGHMFATHEQFADWLREHDPKVIVQGEAALRCFRETGHRDWYEWNCANWGTKWNSYDFVDRGLSEDGTRWVFEFQTANGKPLPVFEELVRRYPDLTFDCETVDEGGPEWEWHYSATEQRCDSVMEDRERRIRVYGREEVERWEAELAEDA